MDPVTLADYQRGVLRAAFREAVARGKARPLLLQWCVLPSMAVPAVFLAVAGKHQALKSLRYPLAAAIAAFNLSLVAPLVPGSSLSYIPTSSLSFASGYGTGLVAGWGTLWALVVLVWTDPWAGERVARRRRQAGGPETDADTATTLVVDEDVTRSLRQGHEYYWQAFPTEASFWARLDWALDLCLSWRGVGWGWCKTPVPHFDPPTRPHTGELVQLASIPDVTPAGYRRHRTRASFFRARLTSFALSYVVLDVCAVLMTQDPHFVVGPPPFGENAVRSWSAQMDQFPSPDPRLPPPALLALPPYIEALPQHPHLLALYRSVLCFAGIFSALTLFLSVDQMVRVFFGGLFFSGSASLSSASTTTQLWHCPSVFGSVAQVRDHGLAGFWGAWWHQTFRTAFVAPTAWLIGRGILPKDRKATSTRLVGLAMAFGQSSLLHAAGSATSLPAHASWWMPPLFFLLSGVGIAVNSVLQSTLLKRLPSPARQASNFIFAFGWLHATQWLFFDDLARSGVWLFEPVPFSVVRWVLFRGQDAGGIVSPGGSSRAGHAAWRWYRDDFASWHTGRHWWESGLAV